MKALVFDRLGPPEVLRITELEAPTPGPGQLRVRVQTAGVQPFDTAVRRGDMPVPVDFPQQLGNEFAGVIDSVGPDVAGTWVVGAEVLGWAPMASIAEYVIADADAVIAKPPDLPWTAAGALGASGQTALTALRILRVSAGDTLLVHAAAGGAGSMAVQIAHARGAQVIGTASAPNHTYLRSLGATPVTYGPGLVQRVRALAPDVSAALDAVGGSSLRDSLALVSDRDRIGTLVAHDVADQLGVHGIRAERRVDQLAELLDLYRRGQLRVRIRRVYPMAESTAAHRLVETGHGAGKVVIQVVS